MRAMMAKEAKREEKKAIETEREQKLWTRMKNRLAEIERDTHTKEIEM